MKNIMFAGLLITLSFFIAAPAPVPADENHINIEVDSRGMTDEYIKLKTHEFEMEEKRTERLEEKARKLSIDAFGIGELYFSKGEYDTAVFYFEKAIYFNEANAQAHERLIEAGRIRDAGEMDMGSHYHRAMDYYRKGMRQKAIEELVIAIKENPDDEEAMVKLNEIESEK